MMSSVSTAGLASIGIIAWFGVAFVTRSWAWQWLAALVAGLGLAWYSYASWAAVPAEGGLGVEGMAPMTFTHVALRSILWMEAVATLGMGLHRVTRRGAPSD